MSGFRKGRRCTFSPSAILHGTVNACIPIQYEDGKKWVLRLTVDGKGCDRDEKVKREIATMSFIRHYTTIPVPKVHHWGLARQNPLGLGPYIITDFIEGIPLATLWNYDLDFSKDHDSDIAEGHLREVYKQLSSFALDLAERDFPTVSSVVHDYHSRHYRMVQALTRKQHVIETTSDVKTYRNSSFPLHDEY